MTGEQIRHVAFSLLDAIRESGKLNMYGAAPYLRKYLKKHFDVLVSRRESQELLKQWMEMTELMAKLESEAA